MTRSMRGWFTAASALTFASVVMGALVCATRSGAACPNWPGCYTGQFVPEAQLNPVIEFTHRVVAGLAGPTVLVAAILGRRLADPRPRRLAWLGLAGTLSAGFFGMLTVKVGIPWWLAVIDLATAFAAVVATLVARLLLTEGATWAPTKAAATAWAALFTVGVMHLLALPVSGVGSLTGCLGWPLGPLTVDRWPWLQAGRVVLAVLAVLLVVATIRRAGRGSASARVGRWVIGGIVLEYALAVGILWAGGSVGLGAAHAVVAATIFGGFALLACRTSLGVRPRETSGNDPIPTALSAE